MKNDTIGLDIRIKVADPNAIDQSNLICENIAMSCGDGCLAKFRLTVENIRQLMAARSLEFNLRNIPWYFEVFKSSSKNFGIRLHFECTLPNVSCCVRMTAKLISLRDAEESIERTEIGFIDSTETLDIDDLISWEQLTGPQNEFIENGSTIVEVVLVNTTEMEVNAIVPIDTATNSNAGAKRSKLV